MVVNKSFNAIKQSVNFNQNKKSIIRKPSNDAEIRVHEKNRFFCLFFLAKYTENPYYTHIKRTKGPQDNQSQWRNRLCVKNL